MIRRTPISTRTATRFPYTTLFRSYSTMGSSSLAFFGAAGGSHQTTCALCGPLRHQVQHRGAQHHLAVLVHRGVFKSHRAERRSEEHTSELQSLMRTSDAVLCMTKKNNNTRQTS